jgi:hypothetical protein
MKGDRRFPPALRRQLVRLGALDGGIERGLRWEELPNGQWKISCRSAFRFAAPDRILSDLGRLADGAGWKAVWEALFSWPESPY